MPFEISLLIETGSVLSHWQEAHHFARVDSWQGVVSWGSRLPEKVLQPHREARPELSQVRGEFEKQCCSQGKVGESRM